MSNQINTNMKAMLLFSLLVFSIISSTNSLSNQEDLAIKNYTQIGCLKVAEDKQMIINDLHENFLSSYQTFFSPSMTIELCFRLCRRWFILLSNNQSNCLCLYTIDQTYEINQYLGDFLSTNNCTSNDIQIYSLTDEISIFPSLRPSVNEDWSLDGCYFVQGIQHVPVNLSLNQMDYLQANELCRKHCQNGEEKNFFSYFLSKKKSCYCSPLKFSQTVKTIALRKPLIHCSFHPYICQAFGNSCEIYYKETSPDTLIKVNVRHYCLSSSSSSEDYRSNVTFDRTFYRCFNSIPFPTPKNFTAVIEQDECLPLLIKTSEQWRSLIQSSWISHSKLIVPIDRNSTYIFNELFPERNASRLMKNFCLIIYQVKNSEIIYELNRCLEVRASGSILCVQKPLQTTDSLEDDFSIIANQSQTIRDEVLSCPPDFVLFDRTCYHIDRTFIYNTRSAERICSEKNSNSTLVKFDSHQWGNINTTKFLGRMYDDLLLEFFYYILEKIFLEQTIDESIRKNWLRLLIGDKNDSNECVLRYFARVSGAFTVFQRCNTGGHPVCQCEPIRTKIMPMETSTSRTTDTTTTTTMTTTTTTTPTSMTTTTSTTTMMTTSTTTSSSSSSILTTTTLICESCTTNTPAGSYPSNNQTIINHVSTNVTLNSTRTKGKHSIYRPLLVILTGPGLALLIFIVGIAFLIRHLRQNHPPQSRRSSTADVRRTKRSSTTVTAGDTPATPAVLPTYLKLPRVSFSESDMLLPYDNSAPSNGEIIELLPSNQSRVFNSDNHTNESKDDPTSRTTVE